MSTFVLTKQHLREVLVFCFNWKKSAAEAHRMLVEVYGDNAPTDKSCREWFRRFKNDDFSVEDKPRSGQPKKFEDKELEALLDEDPSQTQEELAESLGVTQATVSVRLKSMGMILKQGNWVPHELKQRDIERRFFTCEQLIQRQHRKGFLHRIVTGDEKWIFYDNPKKKKYYASRGQSLPSTSTSTPKPKIHGSKVMLCIWWDQRGVVYYELLQPGESITGDRYRLQLIRLSRALRDKRPEYEERHDKVILLHDNARPHVAKVVKTYLETLKWDILPHPPYSPDIAPSDYWLFRRMQHDLAGHRFTSFAEIENWLLTWIASKDETFFRDGIRKLPERWDKVVASDGQYFD